MGNRAVSTPLLIVSVLLGALFLFNPAPAAAASRDSLARSVLDMVTQRLCDRQEKMGGRITLIHPSKCAPTPPPPQEPTVTLTANPTSITAGESTTLTWTSSNATSCTAFLGWSGGKPTSGSAPVSPTQTTTYQLDCTGPGGVGSDDATVTVTVVEEPDEPTVDITAAPMTITAGSSTTLTWNSDNTASCTASNGWSGAKAVDGFEVVSPSVTTTYAISCTGAGGTANDSVTVTVNQAAPEPTLEFSANPTAITTEGTSTLTWASTNATSCTGSGGWSGAKALSGNQIVSPNATTTYTLTCTGVGGSAVKNVTVNIIPIVEEPDAPTVNLVAAPTSVTPGEGTATTTLTWTTTDATSCTASGGEFTGSKAVNSSQVVTPSATTTYTLNCSGPGGDASDSATVNFVPAQSEEPDPTVSLSANPTSVQEGGAGNATTTLTWTSTDATSCTAFGGAWSGSKALSGSEILTPTTTATYLLECTGPGGTASDDVVVTFVPEEEPSGNLLITEVMYDLNTSTTSPQGAEPGNEWVELHNGTNATINLAGYFLHDASSTDALPNVNLPAGAYALITGSSTTATFWSIPGAAVVIVLPNTTIGDGLGNTGDMVWLENSASSTVDSVSWGTNMTGFTPPGAVPTFTANVGDSIGRTTLTDTNVPGDWMRQVNPTPGGTNSN